MKYKTIVMMGLLLSSCEEGKSGTGWDAVYENRQMIIALELRVDSLEAERKAP